MDVKGKGAIDQDETKTKSSKRAIILPAFVVAILTALRPPAPAAADPVFPSRAFKDGRNVGRPQTPHNVRRSLRAALEQAELTGLTHPHQLRHTVATLVERKRGLEAAAALLGHQLKGVTGRSYVERNSVAPACPRCSRRSSRRPRPPRGCGVPSTPSPV